MAPMAYYFYLRRTWHYPARLAALATVMRYASNQAEYQDRARTIGSWLNSRAHAQRGK